MKKVIEEFFCDSCGNKVSNLNLITLNHIDFCLICLSKIAGFVIDEGFWILRKNCCFCDGKGYKKFSNGPGEYSDVEPCKTCGRIIHERIPKHPET